MAGRDMFKARPMRSRLHGSLLYLVQLLYSPYLWASEEMAGEDVPTWPAIIILLVLAIGVLIVNWHHMKAKKPDHDKDRKDSHA